MYAVAGIVIERVTGQTWEEALSSRIFAPLNMKSSNTTIEEQRSQISLPYAEISGTLQRVPFRISHAVNPGGGINSNISDMIKWVQLQLADGRIEDQQILRGQTLQEMHSLQMSMPISSGDPQEIYKWGYGLGWFLENYRGYQCVSHGGLVDGFASHVSLLPTEKMGLVILTNSSSDGQYAVECIRNYIFDRLLKLQNVDWVKRIQDVREQVKQKLGQSLHEGHSERVLQEYLGSYEHPSYDVVEIKLENEHLVALFGNSSTPLHVKFDDGFSGRLQLLEIFSIDPFVDFTFVRDSFGEVSELHIPFEGFRGNKPIVFKKMGLSGGV
jgi:CubicO group peptidase (beta-lactamase class C family)